MVRARRVRRVGAIISNNPTKGGRLFEGWQEL